MDPLDLINAARARRASAGLVANNGIACANMAQVEFYNYRDSLPRNAQGEIIRSPEVGKKLAAMKASGWGK